jgi:ADP-ribose pyrophosphatase YjhB (NUDIX family)
VLRCDWPDSDAVMPPLGKEVALSTDRVALWADRLREIAALGLRFSDSVYDRERYAALQDIAVEMLAAAADQPVARLEPLRDGILSRPTPLVVGDAAIVDHQGRLLLVQRADNGQWAMPGGALEVGETPAQGVVREALEETGVSSEPLALVGVFDSRLCGTTSLYHLYQFVFLCRPLKGGQPRPASHAHEVLAFEWFGEDMLPDDIDPGHVTRIPEVFRMWREGGASFFDR